MIVTVRILFILVSGAAAFFAAFVAAPWAEVEIRIPATLVAVMAGTIVFFVALIALFCFGKLIGDIILFRGCREFLGDMLIEKWRDWKCLLPSVFAGVVLGFVFGPLNGVLACIVLYVFTMTTIYTYGCMQVEAEVGDLLYNNKPPRHQ